MDDLTGQLLPLPQKIALRDGGFKTGPKLRMGVPKNAAGSRAVAQLQEDMRRYRSAELSISDAGPGEIELREETDKAGNDESYCLTISPSGIQIAGGTRGLFYGVQTLAQILAGSPPEALPCCEIEDAPRYAERSVMLDLGRAPFSFALLRRVICICARLKLNTLHLHLNDDHLCGMRFETLPLGAENPAALTVKELKNLIEFARLHQIRIIPEFECWGHAGSVVYHYPALRGGPGLWEGVSFGIGARLYEVLRAVFGELVDIFGDAGHFHVGMDEAVWAILPEEEGRTHSPQTHLCKVHGILQEEAANQHKDLMMRMWLDHTPPELPESIADRISVEPWAYNRSQAAEIRRKVAYCAGRTRRFLMGGGMSSLHLQGAYDATRIWCQEALDSASAEGIDMCIWETNDFSSQLLGIFAGADHAWHPRLLVQEENDPFGERERGKLFLKMRRWQNQFPEANPLLIDEDRGPEVYRGKYVWHQRGERVYIAPTASLLEAESAEFQT